MFERAPPFFYARAATHSGRASMLSSTVAPPCLHTKKAMKTTSPRLYLVVGADCSLLPE